MTEDDCNDPITNLKVGTLEDLGLSPELGSVSSCQRLYYNSLYIKSILLFCNWNMFFNWKVGVDSSSALEAFIQ